MFDCRKARERLPDYLDGALSPALRERLAGHLSACAPCREEHRLLAAARSLLSREGGMRCPSDFTHLAERVARRATRPAPFLWLRRGLVATTAAAALAGFVWLGVRVPEGVPSATGAGVRVREVAEAEELHQAFAVQQSLDERDGLLLFAPRWAEHGP